MTGYSFTQNGNGYENKGSERSLVSQDCHPPIACAWKRRPTSLACCGTFPTGPQCADRSAQSLSGQTRRCGTKRICASFAGRWDQLENIDLI